MDSLKEANEADHRKSGLKIGDTIKIRKTLANLTGDLNSSLSSSTSGSSDTTEEPSVTEPGHHVRSNYYLPKQLFMASDVYVRILKPGCLKNYKFDLGELKGY